MKQTLLFLVCTLASMVMQAQEYFPEGTKWTEIRLDTLKYDSWYSRVGDEWVPNFETIEYYVKGELIDKYSGDGKDKYRCVYTNGPEWTDSLALMIQEEGDAEYVEQNSVMVSVLAQLFDGKSYLLSPGMAYQFDWSVGKDIHYMDISSSNLTGWFSNPQTFGTIEEIKEGIFGGETPLKYVDLNGVRIIQGIGVTEWNDGECLFGPTDPYSALSMYEDYRADLYPERHYRSMLVHFERNGEVLYDVINKTPQMDYRPFVEDDKVWKVGALNSGNPVQWVEYLYFDGDTIIDGKACKQMMRQRYVSPDFPEYDAISQHPSLNYVGAWYEEDKKVYKYDTTLNQFTMMYDFSLEEGGIFQKYGLSYVIGPRQTGGINGFKGVYRDVMMCGEGGNTYNTTWLEGVGNIDGPIYSVYLGKEDHALFLMACAVGDELIYFNDEYEDGATPESAGARKHRFDFTHTPKIQPKTRTRSEAEPLLYGEYNEQQLSIHLDPIYDAYLVSIIDESDKVVYEKSINAGNIVGLNIDISSYSKGNYAVTVENDYESFTGTFEAQTTGIIDVRKKVEEVKDRIYNLQGQRLNSLQKGLNIVNGQKVYVK